MDSYTLKDHLRAAGVELVLDPAQTKLALKKGHANLLPESLKTPLKENYAHLLRGAIFQREALILHRRAIAAADVVGRPDLIDQTFIALHSENQHMSDLLDDLCDAWAADDLQMYKRALARYLKPAYELLEYHDPSGATPTTVPATVTTTPNPTQPTLIPD